MKALITTTLLFFSHFTFACQCIWQGSFNQVYINADLIVSGKILEHKGNATDFEISKVIKGKEFQEVIRLWGDTGNLCRPNIYTFEKNSEWVLALHRIEEVIDGGFNPNTPSFSFGRVGDYAPSICGAYWLQLQNGHVRGNLINGQRWQWQDKKMTPVRIEILEAYINGKLDEKTLSEAAKPQKELQDLMKNTLRSLEN